jgi:hypothetical protein
MYFESIKKKTTLSRQENVKMEGTKDGGFYFEKVQGLFNKMTRPKGYLAIGSVGY